MDATRKLPPTYDSRIGFYALHNGHCLLYMARSDLAPPHNTLGNLATLVKGLCDLQCKSHLAVRKDNFFCFVQIQAKLNTVKVTSNQV
jgi:hypothetical protein